MAYCSMNKTSAVLIRCLTFGGTNATEEFTSISIQNTTLFAVGYSYSNDFGFSFTFGRADVVVLRLDLATETPQILKNIGTSLGNEIPFKVLIRGG